MLNENEDLEEEEEEEEKAKSNTKVDSAWNKIFSKFGIPQHIDKYGVFTISSKDINPFHQARLMAKFDHAKQLPPIFKKHEVSIQPLSRGTYAIGHFESYFDKLPQAPTPQILDNASPFQSLDPKKLTSESAALLYACHTGMLAELLDEEMDFTVFGRMGSGQFEYSINNCLNSQPYSLRVENAQCEVDGGFEGERQFCIVEAKNATVEDFLVRQLGSGSTR